MRKPDEPDLTHPGLALDAVSDEFLVPEHGPEHFQGGHKADPEDPPEGGRMGAPSGEIDCYPADRGPLEDGASVVYGWQVTSWFGGRIDPITGQPGSHGGEDQAYSGCGSSPIIAPIGGLLSQGWDPSGGGNWSGIDGHNGDYWGFGHAEAFAFPGGSRWVDAGTVIAWTGTTGGSTGPHNHIAYRRAGASSYCDPHDVLLAAANAGNEPAPSPWDEEDMPKQFVFPDDGATYFLAPNPDVAAGFEWQYIGGPAYQEGAVYAGAVSDQSVGLASGDDWADTIWNRFPVANGPKVNDH